MFSRCHQRFHGKGRSAIGCLLAAVLLLVFAVPAQSAPDVTFEDTGCGLIEVPVTLSAVQGVEALLGAGQGGRTDFRGCPPLTVTHSSADFSGGTYVLQQGFVEEEIAAVSYTVDAGDFPIIVNVMEMIFSQMGAIETTTTEWSVIVWQGTPSTGTVVATYSSDDIILPHIVFPPSSSPQGVNVSVTVDPEDPEQIVVQDNGSHTFSVGFRVDKHHQPATAPCSFGDIPAECCSPGYPRGWNNAFPTVDANGAQHSSQNWLRCRDGCGLFACAGGWHDNNYIGMAGDWNIRATYTPVTCAGQGACCLDGGACVPDLTEAECLARPGEWAGLLTTCDDNDDNGTADVCEDEPECLQYDLDGNGFVGGGDINLIKANYGPCTEGPCLVCDIDGNGFVGGGDINLIKANYGPCP